MYACVCELPVDTPSTFSFSPSLFLLSRYTSELRANRDDNRQGNWTMEIMSKVRVQTGKGGRRTTRGRIAFPLLFFFVDEYLVVACRHLFSVCSAFHCCASDCCDQLVWLRYGSRTGPELDDLLVHFSDEMFLCHITLDE